MFDEHVLWNALNNKYTNSTGIERMYWCAGDGVAILWKLHSTKSEGETCWLTKSKWVKSFRIYCQHFEFKIKYGIDPFWFFIRWKIEICVQLSKTKLVIFHTLLIQLEDGSAQQTTLRNQLFNKIMFDSEVEVYVWVEFLSLLPSARNDFSFSILRRGLKIRCIS